MSAASLTTSLGLRTYAIEVKTGNESGAGTDANIRIQLIGTNGVTQKHLLDKAGNDDFEQDDRDIYNIALQDVGVPQQIKFFNDGAGAGSSWLLSWVKVTTDAAQGLSNVGTWGARYDKFVDTNGVTLSLSPATSGSDWMSRIAKTTSISQINIPGTHDSGTFEHSQSPSVNYDICQTQTIYQQLQMGIRFLDIRLRWFINTSANSSTPPKDQGNFTVYHSNNWQNLYFDQSSWRSPDDTGMQHFILQDCLRFLKRYPSETIVMSIKKEYYKNDAERDGFDQAFRDLIARHDNGDNFYTGTTVPTLEDARGRIVIVNRDNALDSSYGIEWAWPDGDRGIDNPGVLYVEDNYKDTTSSAKEANILRSLNKATGKALVDQTWVVTFVSCAPGNAPPVDWASDMNAYVDEYVTNQLMANRNTYFGTVIMDFPPQELVDRLISQYVIPL